KTYDVLLAETGQGNNAAAAETERAIAHFRPSLAFFVGVSGGIKDVGLGDVVAADTVFNYESGKATENFEARPAAEHCTYRLVQTAKEISRMGRWTDRIGGEGPSELPRALVGHIAAGEKVVASKESDAYQLIQSQY